MRATASPSSPTPPFHPSSLPALAPHLPLQHAFSVFSPLTPDQGFWACCPLSLCLPLLLPFHPSPLSTGGMLPHSLPDSSLNLSSSLLLSRTLPYFADEQTETQREGICPGAPSSSPLGVQCAMAAGHVTWGWMIVPPPGLSVLQCLPAKP